MSQSGSERDPFEQDRPGRKAPDATPGPPLPADGRPSAGGEGQLRPGTAALPDYKGTPPPPAGDTRRPVTRAGMIWAAVASALVVLVLLIIFILQNQVLVQVKFFGLEGVVSLGLALFIAAVAGGVLVAMAGAARIIQLRAADHRRRVAEMRRR
ncbi:LapA family protein [Arthrobacter sp. D1-17]